MQRAVVVHPMIEGQCVMSRVVERMEWIDKGVQRDWECMEEDYKEEIKKRVDSICYSWFLDPLNYQPNSIEIPPSQYFLQFSTASPFFRNVDMIIYY